MLFSLFMAEGNKNLKKVKLKSGLEIHQQLDGGKLFCRCPSVLRRDEPDWIVHRRLHAVAGEGGEIDVAVKHEAALDKEFIYQGYKDSNCLVEFDEQPPLEIDKEALRISVEIGLLLNCDIMPITQIMRKTVIDGSNVSGFQRTVLIARDGFIETSKGKVGIWYVYLEEDAGRKVDGKNEGAGGESNGKKIYRLDRLGIPMVEVVTAPDIKDPEQVKEVALKIGEILRACKVRRGLGTIRQDINISIPGHPRAEIKGFQDPKIFVEVVEKEIERQSIALKNKDKLANEVRGANPDATTRFLRPLPGKARMYPETDLPLLKISKSLVDECKKNLPKLKTEHEEALRGKGLSEEMISQLLKSGKLEDFETLLASHRSPSFIVKVLLMFTKEIANKAKVVADEVFTLDILETILSKVEAGKVHANDIKTVMQGIAEGKEISQALKIQKVDNRNLEAEIAKIVKEKPGLTAGGYMGLVMAKLGKGVDGKAAMGILGKLVK
jgi:Glu-tRNA(Gln) amidotransferase subunit E-like FAD-binding protein